MYNIFIYNIMLYITYIIYKIMYDICRESIDIYIGVYRLYIYIYTIGFHHKQSADSYNDITFRILSRADESLKNKICLVLL